MEVDHKQYEEDYYINYWAPLRSTIESFLRPQPNSGLSSFHEIFSLIYKCVCDGQATTLYTDLLELCRSHSKMVHVQLMHSLTAVQTNSKQEDISNLIKEFDEQLSIYLKASSNISSVFCYLVRYLEGKLGHGCPLETELKRIFCREVADHYVCEIQGYLDNSPPPNLDPVLIQRLLKNLEIVSQHKYNTRYDTPSPSDMYEPATQQAEIPERMCQEEVGSQKIFDYVIGLNPAQKRRADERD